MAARDIIQAAAGAAGATEAVYVEDVFSTYLFTSTGTAQTITTGMDLSTNSGLVWCKNRTSVGDNILSDTVRGSYSWLSSNTTGAATGNFRIGNFSTSGFDVVNSGSWLVNGNNYASWAFRKQPKFFDVVTYTGTGSARTIAHSLGATPGMIIVKRTDTSSNWQVYHNGLTSAANSIQLNLTAAQASATTVWNSTAPTSSVFSVGSDATVNASGGTYVAYLFAASNSGGFGPAGTDSVVACGSYTGNGSTDGPTVTLGWEPQWVMVKAASPTGDWFMSDIMRGQGVSLSSSQNLYANKADAETLSNFIAISSTGFSLTANFTALNGYNHKYIYLAIRRGPMKTPTIGTSVYNASHNVAVGQPPAANNFGFPVDWYLIKQTGGNSYAWTRSTGTPYLNPTTTDAEAAASNVLFDNNQGMNVTSTGTGYRSWGFKRAPGFFDVVCYTGTGTNRTVAHNLGVAPELMIVKNRDLAGYGWAVYASPLPTPQTNFLILNGTNGGSGPDTTFWNSTNPTSSIFSLGTVASVNRNGNLFVAYLFATCPGVSKVGSYTGNGSSQTIDCGFTAGARFVLIKRTDSTGDWYVWDTARGIVAGNDPHLSLNSAVAEVTTDDSIDPASSGFIVNQLAATNVNVTSATYIYLAIA